MDRICNEALLRKVTTPRAAAAHIKNGMTVGFSGFTVIGYPKVLPVELARRAEEGEELGITVITGGNVGDQLDGVLARSGVMKGPITRRRSVISRQAVAEFRQTTLFVSIYSDSFFSKSFVFGPVVIQPLLNVSTTSAISSSVISGGEKAICMFFIKKLLSS